MKIEVEDIWKIKKCVEESTDEYITISSVYFKEIFKILDQFMHSNMELNEQVTKFKKLQRQIKKIIEIK